MFGVTLDNRERFLCSNFIVIQGFKKYSFSICSFIRLHQAQTCLKIELFGADHTIVIYFFISGAFAAYFDFNLVSWLRIQRHSIARISDFPLALMRLHAQFKWPYPLVSQSIVEQLTKRIEGIKISPSTASLDSLQCKLLGDFDIQF